MEVYNKSIQSEQVKGGYHSVKNIAERDNIPFAKRLNSAIYVTELETLFIYKASVYDSVSWQTPSNWQTVGGVSAPPSVNTIDSIEITVLNVSDTSIGVSFTGGTGGIGSHTFTFQYKESGSFSWKQLTAYVPEVTSGEPTRIYKYEGLKEATEYELRLLVTDSQGFTKEGYIPSISTLLLIFKFDMKSALSSTANDQISLKFRNDDATPAYMTLSLDSGFTTYNINPNGGGYYNTTIRNNQSQFPTEIGGVGAVYASPSATVTSLSTLYNSFNFELGVENLKSLEILTLFSIKQKSLDIGGNYPLLERLTIIQCDLVLENTVDNVVLKSIRGGNNSAAYYCADWSRFKSLEELKISNMRKSIMHSLLADNAATMDVSMLSALKFLSLRGGSPSDMVDIVGTPNHAVLEALYLSSVNVVNGLPLTNATNLIGLAIETKTNEPLPVDFSATTQLKEVRYGLGVVTNAVGTIPSTFRHLNYSNYQINPSTITLEESQRICNLVCQIAARGNDDNIDDIRHNYSNSSDFHLSKRITINESHINDNIRGGNINRESITNTINVQGANGLMQFKESLDILEARGWTINITNNNYLN